MYTSETRLLLYGVIFALYHLTEFGLHRFIHGRFEYSSLLFSIPFALAQLTLLVEYLLIHSYFHTPPWVFFVGGFGILLGLGLRWVAMLTAHTSFHHIIQTTHRLRRGMVDVVLWGCLSVIQNTHSLRNSIYPITL